MLHLGAFLAILLISACVSFSSTSSGLKVEIRYRPKDCPVQAQVGDLVRFLYIGHLYDVNGPSFVGSFADAEGTARDEYEEETIGQAGSRRSKDSYYDYILGAEGSVILDVLNAGMMGACKGETRFVTIPPEMGMSKIKTLQNIVPADADVHYTLEVMEIIQGEKAIEEYKQEHWKEKRKEEL